MSDKAPQKILCIRVTGPDEAIRALLSRYPAESNAVQRSDHKVSIEILLPEQAVEQIDQNQLQVEVLYDASARGRERQKEVGRGNRFEGDIKVFRGLGTKTKEEPR